MRAARSAASWIRRARSAIGPSGTIWVRRLACPRITVSGLFSSCATPAQELADRGEPLAAEQGLPLTLELLAIAPPLRDVDRDAEHGGPAAAEHPPAVHVQVDDGAVHSHHPEAVPDGVELAGDAPLEIPLHDRAIPGVDDVERAAPAQELVRRVAEHLQRGLVEVDEPVVGGEVDADQGLLDQRAELGLRLRELGRALLELGHDLVEGARHLARVLAQLRPGAHVPGAEPLDQLDQRGVQTASGNRMPVASDGPDPESRTAWRRTPPRRATLVAGRAWNG